MPRPIEQWDRSDLDELVANQVHESLTLDYKASAALAKTDACKRELSKDVSAFANSAGGRIVFGITEDNYFPNAVDDGVDPAIITREWIEQVLQSNINPRLQGLVIKQISVGPNRVAYVLDIPQATAFAPHQSGHRYYKRFNFESRPMEDYEVRDTLRRTTTPAPFLLFSSTIPELAENAVSTKLRVRIGNRSNEPALYSVVSIFVDNRLWTQVGLPEYATSDSAILTDGVQYGVKRMVRNYGIPGSFPLFKEQTFYVGEIPLLIGPAPGFLGYSIATPGYFTERFGSIRFDGNAAIIEGFEET